MAENSIGALVLTYNEEDNIKDCLESIKWVDEIVVVDSYSDDDTIDICKEYTDKVYARKFDNFSSQRNFGLGKLKTDWVLVVDADERVTPELKEEIYGALQSGPFLAYQVPRKNYFLGRWIKYCGWYPDYTLRLFKVSEGDYKFSGKVHEDVRVNGKVGILKNPLVHLTYRDLSSYIKKMDLYSTLWAEEKFKKGKEVGLLYILLRPPVEFIKKYFLKRGFLSGSEGFILSIVSSYYVFLKYAKLWEQNKSLSGAEDH
ncbi:glycosyltransferase family 2 protein [Halothermothrix orenii]|uniref:Glycosyl transferase family 2 n=1 Tax=Halothermothrix orenii (strain H 168 / OCM 544 / DSM 9562) TaxID=373903 RepID=B8CZB6_HALOH|nr:glycosyltransferase family 2 protein [Halothermothrix orenii]ACL70635.1 glycosyl transferase family 2 [Halothermothrix orenii H 168]